MPRLADISFNGIFAVQSHRRRVNNCLEQLRSLLPFLTSMKRDMASLLEQTVEYINTMHTVLNVEKPACLSKIYVIYQKKIEEHNFRRKAATPRPCKRKLSNNESCSSTTDGQHPSPEICGGFSNEQFNDEPGYSGGAQSAGAKRLCSAYLYNQGGMHPVPSNMHPPQQIVEPMGMSDVNNNNYMHSFVGMPCGNDFRPEMHPSNCYIFGQSPLAMCPKQTSHDQHAQFMPTYSKINTIGGEIEKSANQCCHSPAFEKVFQQEVLPENCYSGWEDGLKNPEHSTAAKPGRKTLNISSLVYNPDRSDETGSQVANSQWYQHRDITSVLAPYDSLQKVDNNPAHNLLAPMDMSDSPTNVVDTSPHFIGAADKLIRRDLPSCARDEGNTLKNSTSVSRMLNEVTGSNTSSHIPRGSFGSTERKVTPVFGWMKSPGHVLSVHDAAISLAMDRPSSAPAPEVCRELGHGEPSSTSASSASTPDNHSKDSPELTTGTSILCSSSTTTTSSRDSGEFPNVLEDDSNSSDRLVKEKLVLHAE